MNKKDNQNFSFRLENKSRATNFFLLFIFSGVIFTGIAFYLISHESAVPLIALTLLAVGYFVLFSKAKPSFFEFMVFENHFSIRHYSVAAISRDYQSVEVSLAEFHGFSEVRSVFGMKRELIIAVRTPYGIAEYPPISITLLKKKDRERLYYVLKKFMPPIVEPK